MLVKKENPQFEIPQNKKIKIKYKTKKRKLVDIDYVLYKSNSQTANIDVIIDVDNVLRKKSKFIIFSIKL